MPKLGFKISCAFRIPIFPFLHPAWTSAQSHLSAASLNRYILLSFTWDVFRSSVCSKTSFPPLLALLLYKSWITSLYGVYGEKEKKSLALGLHSDTSVDTRETPGGYSLRFLVAVCPPYLQIQTQFQTKKCHFPHPFSDILTSPLTAN